MVGKCVIKELSPALGVQVSGVDLRNPVDEVVADLLRKAYTDHLLVLFRGQELSPDEQVRALGLFGPVLDEVDDGSYYSLVSSVDDEAYIGSMSNTTELVFHSDLTNTGSPPWGLSLYAMEVVGDSPVTRYVNTQRAYVTLSPDRRQEVERLEVTDIFDYPAGYEPSGDAIDPRIAWASCASTHPAVIDHPRNRKRQIYCNQMWTNQVVGMDPADARATMAKVFEHLYQAAHMYEHEWAAGDLVVWDNVAVQHSRKPIPAGCRRRLRRVVIGEKTPELIRTTKGIMDIARMPPG